MAEKDAKAAGQSRKVEKGQPPKTNLLYMGLGLIVIGLAYTVWDVFLRAETKQEKLDRESLEFREMMDAKKEAAEKKAAKK